MTLSTPPRPSRHRSAALRLLGALLLSAGLMACASQPRLQEDPDDYRAEVARLQREIAERPSAAAPLRDLGAIYVRTQRPAEGITYLQQAFARNADDPKTLFFLGVASETLGRTQRARRLYERYDEVPDDSPYRRLLRGRYEWLLRQEIRAEIAQMMQREQELSDGDVSPRIVAVFPLVYQGANKRYAPLGRGLSEMMTVDLGYIDDLRLVERVRLQELLSELRLAESDYVNPATAPRVGRLLGAGRLVGGAYTVDGGDLRMDIALAELERDTTAPDLESQSGALADLFALQKEAVFRVIDRFGIELTAEERAAIETIPTQNLQAFLAYSRGLLLEDTGDFEAAAQAFQQARELDPSFGRAVEGAERAGGLNAAAGPTESVLTAATVIEPPPSSIDLVNSRLRTMTTTIGAGFVAGQDQRQPAAEGSPERLADPPPPPPRGGNQ